MSIFDRSARTGFDGPEEDARLAAARDRMVEEQIRRRGIRDETVLEALRQVPRHLFVPLSERRVAYADRALPIGHGQTISQPYIVALMTEALRLETDVRVLEVGTGSGYQAAVLAACRADVWSVERIPELHRAARSNLDAAGYGDRVRLRLGDGSRGWPEVAPFDRALLTAAAEELPPAIPAQVRPGGLIVGPVGEPHLQTICRYTVRPDGGLGEEALEGARFVPLIPEGDAETDGTRPADPHTREEG